MIETVKRESGNLILESQKIAYVWRGRVMCMKTPNENN